LLEIKMPQGRRAEPLLGFGLGVEVGQLSVMLLRIGLIALLESLR
jgi:hypothetical protein